MQHFPNTLFIITLKDSNLRRILEPVGTVIFPLQFKLVLYGVKSTMPVSMLDLVFKALLDVYLICPIAQKVSENSLNMVEHNVCLDLGNNVSEI